MRKNQKKRKQTSIRYQDEKKMRSGNTDTCRKQEWKPGNMLYPLPAVMVTVADKTGKDNIITVAWTGTVCTNPPMLYISVRPERYSYHMLRETAVHVSELYMDEKGKFHLEEAEPVVYSHGAYFGLNHILGTFGYSIRKK